MCALLLQSRKFWWYILLISLMLFYDVIMTLYCCQRASDNDFVFLQDSAIAHRAAHEQQLNCCVKKQQTFLRPNCGLQTTQISVLWITRSGLSCSIMSTTDKFIVWMNWNGGSSMSDAVLNSRILTRILRGWLWACVHAKGGYFEYSLCTDNVDFVHICYIQCV